MNEILTKIDELIVTIKTKDNSQSYFPRHNLERFEFMFFLCLDIIRYELPLNNRLSDLTADAMNVMFGSFAFQYYNQDFPEISAKCAMLFSELVSYNEKLRNYDLRNKIGFKESDWVHYYKKILSSLLLANIESGPKDDKV